MARTAVVKKIHKTPKQLYVLDDQIGFILRLVSQPFHHFCPRDWRQLDADPMGGLVKVGRDRNALTERAWTAYRHGCRDDQGVIDRLTARGLTETGPDAEDGRRLWSASPRPVNNWWKK
jgi:hypothetical protein